MTPAKKIVLTLIIVSVLGTGLFFVYKSISKKSADQLAAAKKQAGQYTA